MASPGRLPDRFGDVLGHRSTLFQQKFVGKSRTFVIPGLADSFSCACSSVFLFYEFTFHKNSFLCFFFIAASTQCVLQKLISPTHERRTHKKNWNSIVSAEKFANYLKKLSCRCGKRRRNRYGSGSGGLGAEKQLKCGLSCAKHRPQFIHH